MKTNEPGQMATESGGILSRGDGTTIAYNRLVGKNPGVVFLHGFKSDRSGGKALAVEAFCRDRGQAFLRFDCQGHGESSGLFEEGSIGLWLEDALAAFDALTEGPQILVGSSMGGWLALLLALQRPQRVAGLLGLAAAADFTEDLIFDAFTPRQKTQLLSEGRVLIEDCYGGAPYPITRQLIEEGRRHLLLHGPIGVVCPVRLIHGLADADVPWRTALRLQEHLTGPDVEVTLVKGGGHRLSEPQDISRMLAVLARLIG